jgi:phenylalanyl-tRNA synthetase beta chain
VLERLLDVELSQEELLRHLMHLGCDVEGVAELRRFRCGRCGNILEITETQEPPVVCDRCGADFREAPELLESAGTSEVIRMEALAVRPDMFDPAGLARVLRAYLGHMREPVEHTAAPPQLTVEVDPSTQGPECPRPAIACAVIRNLTLDDDLVKVVMKLQENLHWALGRDRKHASIGVYDLDTLSIERPLRYGSVGPEELQFVPLGYDPSDPASAITPRRILAEHPKGTAFARLLEGWSRYPLLSDGAGQVLSMPPIINSEATRVHLGTTSMLVDVTGSERRIVSKALNVLVTSILDLIGDSRLEAVEIVYPSDTTTTPDLSWQLAELDWQACARMIGIDVDAEKVAELLGRMGHKVTAPVAGPFEVEVPPYRNDILHPNDLMEDVAIAYGYHNIAPRLDPTFTVGQARAVEEVSDLVRRAMTGLGLWEVMTLYLTSPEVAFDALRRERDPASVLIDNPISADETMPRVALLPGLLQTLQRNTHRELPQRIFEVGDITRLDPDAETGSVEVRHLAAAVINSTASFEELRPVVEAALAELGWGLVTEPLAVPTYIDGRGAQVVAVRGEGRRAIGEIGELHPEVLEAFRIRHPVVAFEIDLAALFV